MLVYCYSFIYGKKIENLVLNVVSETRGQRTVGLQCTGPAPRAAGRRLPTQRGLPAKCHCVHVEGGGACFIPERRALPVAKLDWTVPPVSTGWRRAILSVDQTLSPSLRPSSSRAAGRTPHLNRCRLPPSQLDVYPNKVCLLHSGLPVWGDRGPPAGMLSAACPLVAEEENRNVEMQDTRDRVVSWSAAPPARASSPYAKVVGVVPGRGTDGDLDQGRHHEWKDKSMFLSNQ
ncbi:hypothetical protein HJG60_010032 [Phyllostomus discolor]|uniref:Uncharacterized protein n=1 Tax=Phyllostomus discolor TaxID=89673 RepID=A0A834EJI7_9CHIR|nr:hypothetical protein HJG60_010032 [Phyllostomus discolor]